MGGDSPPGTNQIQESCWKAGQYEMAKPYSVSVLKLLDSLESFVIERRQSDSRGAADVDAGKPTEIQSGSSEVPNRPHGRGVGGYCAAHSAAAAWRRQAPHRHACGGELPDVHPSRRLSVALYSEGFSAA